MSYFIRLDGVSNTDIGIHIESRPTVPAPVLNITEIKVPGRSGTLHATDGSYPNIKLSYQFAFKTDEDKVIKKYMEVKKWLYGASTLFMSDYDGMFLKVSNVVVGDLERRSKRISGVTAELSCFPLFFSYLGQSTILNPTQLYNDGEQSYPKYIITGEGNATLTVNGNEFAANIGEMITLDTELGIAYRSDGTNADSTVDGDYEDIIFNEGVNTLSITDGFTLKVIPNWRYL